MNIKTQLVCLLDIHEKELIAPLELTDHLRNGTISRKGNVVFDKDHKYVVLRNMGIGDILYFMVYDHSDADFSTLAEYACSLCASGKALTDTFGRSQYDFIGFGTFALTKMREESVFTLFYQRKYHDEARSHYLDALRDDVRQELADLFDVSVQIQFDLRAVSVPREQTCRATT